MESINDNFGCHVYKLMTNREHIYLDEFLEIISDSNKLENLLKLLTYDLIHKIITTPVGIGRVQSIIEISKEEVHYKLYIPIMMSFTDIMTRGGPYSYDLALQMLKVRNVQQKKSFLRMTHRYALDLAHNKYGCVILKKVITLAVDSFKGKFLDLIADNSYSLCMDGLGISLIRHMLELEFTRNTTQEVTYLHTLMVECDETLKGSDFEELRKFALKLTSDSDLFVDFLKTRRGSLMVQILGKSEEIDMMLFRVIKERLRDVVTNKFGSLILSRVLHVFEKRGNFEVDNQIQKEIIQNAVYISKDPIGSCFALQHVTEFIDEHCSPPFAIALHHQRGYIELSFDKYGSKIVEKLVGNVECLFNLWCMVREIVKCDENTLVRLAKDEYGSRVLMKTLFFARNHKVDHKFRELVEKLKPVVGRLRRSQEDIIASIIEYHCRFHGF